MVTFVTPLVNPVNPPRTPEENEETLFTTDAAKDEPGSVGIETLGRPPPDEIVGADTVDVPVDKALGRTKVGS